MLDRRTAAILLFALPALGATTTAIPAAAPNPWVRVRTAHFTVSGNVGERRAREVSANLEQFRQVMSSVSRGAPLAVRPLFVVAFDSEKAYAPFKPLRHGKPAPVTGYFAWNADGNCVTLQIDRGKESYPVIFHEYAHLFLTAASRNLPLWLSEGLAEYYSTTDVARQGREAQVGIPVDRHVLLLRGRGLMVLRDLLATTESSRLFDRADDSELFYAQAWALVHQLSSQPDDGAKLAGFIEKVASGRPHVEALEETFGPLKRVEAALQHYIENGIYRYRTVRTTPPPAPPAARPMSPAEVDATEAVVLTYHERYDEAASHVDAALKGDGQLVEAHVAAGLLARRRGRFGEAEKAFREAANRGGDANLDAAYYWGVSLLEMPGADGVSLGRAREALAAALPDEDPPADALAVLGLLLVQGNHLDEGEALLRRSMRLMPGQPRTTAGLADVLIRQGKYDEARGLLGPMIERPGSSGEEDIGRRLMRLLDQTEMRTRLRDELARLSAAPPPGGKVASGRRARGPGEAGQAGLLEEIDCRREGLVVNVQTTSGPMRFYAAGLDAVEFIGFRPDLPAGVGCGARKPPETVLVTWKPLDGALPADLGLLAGRVVAVELLPK